MEQWKMRSGRGCMRALRSELPTNLALAADNGQRDRDGTQMQRRDNTQIEVKGKSKVVKKQVQNLTSSTHRTNARARTGMPSRPPSTRRGRGQLSSDSCPIRAIACLPTGKCGDSIEVRASSNEPAPRSSGYRQERPELSDGNHRWDFGEGKRG